MPRTPARFTPQPSNASTGDAVATGFRLGDDDLIIYFTGTDQWRRIRAVWRNTKTQRVTDVSQFGTHSTGGGAQMRNGFQYLEQAIAGRGVLEYGAFQGSADRITSTVDGKTYDAAFTTWGGDPSVVVFWLLRPGDPAPREAVKGTPEYTPIPDSEYPLITAYGQDGRVLAAQRLRSPGMTLKSA